MAKKELHPAMKARAEATREGYAHLKANDPGFSKLSNQDKFKAVQNHVSKKQ